MAVKFWSRFFSFFLFRAVFQIPLESNYGLVIGFSTNENQNPSHLARLWFSRALSKLQAIAPNSDWSIALFAPVVIGGSNFFSIGLLQSFENRLVNKVQAPVVQKVDNAIHRINHYPLDIAIGFAITYPVDSDLSGG